MSFKNGIRRLFSSMQPSLMGGSILDKDVDKIAISISKLNLIQTSQLVTHLKTLLNLPDTFHHGVSPLNIVQQISKIEESHDSTVTVEKQDFNVTLQKFDATSKAKIIRQIKSMNSNMNLVEAKTFVESVPKVIKEAIKRDEADKIKKIFEELGATIIIE